MLLHSLFRQFDPPAVLTGIPDIEIHGVREDSRQIRPGDLFVARQGTRADGAQYVRDAAARGAAAVVVDAAVEGIALPQVVLKDTASAASVLANQFHGNPSHAVRVLGVTGTNGKTTTAYLVRHLLTAAGFRCGMVGTVEVDDGRGRREANMTTPAAYDVADLLGAMRNNGCAACAMEVSSHALDQGRVAGVRFAAAAFTNLTGDHLDYHGGMENYAAAKAKLFASLETTALAVVNARDGASGRMLRDCGARVVRFGFEPGAEYRASDLTITAQGTRFILDAPDGQADVRMGLIGRHNAENLLAAAALVGQAFGLPVQKIAEAAADAAGAPGRLQAVRAGQRFAVFVDYAHTDDGLKNVLEALRPVTRGRLRVLFGCGGDRDRFKRPRMAATAERLADDLYVTSDNPRSEDPGRIIADILAGLTAPARKAAVVESDRRAAIDRILTDAQPADVVLLAGKGHEKYQIVDAEKRHFDDVEEATRVLQARGVAA